ncbi:MAG: MATE family efflux transporter [Bacillota bacterium]|nr:MATE family efflux transporter [Bacillota bacterium]
MGKNLGKDLTSGSIAKHLLAFSIPMFAGNLLQITYSIINTIWVGNIIGKDGIGATTVSIQILFILVGISSGSTVATTILVSQYYGARNMKMVERIVNNSFSIALIFGTVLTVAGILSSNQLLRIMNTPPEVFVQASGYLKISMASFLIMFLAYLISSILRGIGDTITPLTFYIIGVVLNAVLDPLLIIGIGPFPKLGLNGAAYASVIAQVIAMTIGLVYLNRKGHILAIKPKKFRLDKDILIMIVKLGFPSAVQQTLISVGAAVVTSFVNVFGASAIDAYGAASRVDSIASQPAMSIGSAASAVTGQNLGAKKPERINEIFKWGMTMTIIITGIISIIAISIPAQILSIFGIGKDTDVIQTGKVYLRIVGSSYVFYAVMYLITGIINGAGHTVITMVFSILSIWFVRIILSLVLSETSLKLNGIWLSIVISNAIVMLVNILYYFSGRWKKEVIKHEVLFPEK